MSEHSGLLVGSWRKPYAQGSQRGSESPCLEIPVASLQFPFLRKQGAGVQLSPGCPWPSWARRPGIPQRQAAGDHNQPIHAGVPKKPLGKVHERAQLGPGQGCGHSHSPREPCLRLSGLASGLLPSAQLVFLKSCCGGYLCSGLHARPLGLNRFDAGPPCLPYLEIGLFSVGLVKSRYASLSLSASLSEWRFLGTGRRFNWESA